MEGWGQVCASAMSEMYQPSALPSYSHGFLAEVLLSSSTTLIELNWKSGTLANHKDEFSHPSKEEVVIATAGGLHLLRVACHQQSSDLRKLNFVYVINGSCASSQESLSGRKITIYLIGQLSLVAIHFLSGLWSAKMYLQQSLLNIEGIRCPPVANLHHVCLRSSVQSKAAWVATLVEQNWVVCMQPA